VNCDTGRFVVAAKSRPSVAPRKAHTLVQRLSLCM
jgi:hypothetical protein